MTNKKKEAAVLAHNDPKENTLALSIDPWATIVKAERRVQHE